MMTMQVDGVVWRGSFTAAESGPLIYQPASVGTGLRLTWLDRTQEKEVGSLSGATIPRNQKGIVNRAHGGQIFNSVALSDDGKRAAVTIGNPRAVIWIYDVEHNTRSRFSFGGSANSPVWSHDGKQIAYLAAVETDGIPVAHCRQAV